MFAREFNRSGLFGTHMLDYWNAHLKNPRKLLFLKYEDLKQDVSCHIKRFAEFIGVALFGGRKKTREGRSRRLDQSSDSCNGSTRQKPDGEQVPGLRFSFQDVKKRSGAQV
ncbi:Cytosolic sulfotransferase 14 [Sesamum alatum]|uniref:Sulfotransferase n=1 Tax=Sesamum alatum TaxID=300844 RepID=A0AAE1Y267_9LAMI|nr:Cytosolic sulfotransferase 14 [Sesamum alatum]